MRNLRPSLCKSFLARTLSSGVAALLLLDFYAPGAEAQPRRPASDETKDLALLRRAKCPPKPRHRLRRKRYARKYYRLGIKLAGKNQLALAMQALKCSFGAYPHHDTYYNFAKLAEKTNRFGEAIWAYHKYLKLNPQARDRVAIEEKIEILEKALLQKAREAKVKKLAARLAREKLAALRRAQKAREQAKLSRLEARRAVDRLKLERQSMALELAAKRRKLTTAAWIVGGAGVAALVLGSIVGGLALADKHKVENGQKDDPWLGDIAEASERNRTFSMVSYICVGAGALLVTGAGLLYGLSRRITVERVSPPRLSPRPRVQVTPSIGPAGGGVQVVVTF